MPQFLHNRMFLCLTKRILWRINFSHLKKIASTEDKKIDTFFVPLSKLRRFSPMKLYENPFHTRTISNGFFFPYTLHDQKINQRQVSFIKKRKIIRFFLSLPSISASSSKRHETKRCFYDSSRPHSFSHFIAIWTKKFFDVNKWESSAGKTNCTVNRRCEINTKSLKQLL